MVNEIQEKFIDQYAMCDITKSPRNFSTQTPVNGFYFEKSEYGKWAPIMSGGKGGTGKSTLTQIISEETAKYTNNKVLEIDGDPAANLDEKLGITNTNPQKTVYAFLNALNQTRNAITMYALANVTLEAVIAIKYIETSEAQEAEKMLETAHKKYQLLCKQNGSKKNLEMKNNQWWNSFTYFLSLIDKAFETKKKHQEETPGKHIELELDEEIFDYVEKLYTYSGFTKTQTNLKEEKYNFSQISKIDQEVHQNTPLITLNATINDSIEKKIIRNAMNSVNYDSLPSINIEDYVIEYDKDSRIHFLSNSHGDLDKLTKLFEKNHDLLIYSLNKAKYKNKFVDCPPDGKSAIDISFDPEGNLIYKETALDLMTAKKAKQWIIVYEYTEKDEKNNNTGDFNGKSAIYKQFKRINYLASKNNGNIKLNQILLILNKANFGNEPKKYLTELKRNFTLMQKADYELVHDKNILKELSENGTTQVSPHFKILQNFLTNGTKPIIQGLPCWHYNLCNEENKKIAITSLVDNGITKLMNLETVETQLKNEIKKGKSTKEIKNDKTWFERLILYSRLIKRKKALIE